MVRRAVRDACGIFGLAKAQGRKGDACGIVFSHECTNGGCLRHSSLPQISQICAERGSESGSGCLRHLEVAHRLHGFHRLGTDGMPASCESPADFADFRGERFGERFVMPVAFVGSSQITRISQI